MVTAAAEEVPADIVVEELVAAELLATGCNVAAVVERPLAVAYTAIDFAVAAMGGTVVAGKYPPLTCGGGVG
jgi:hypothetical protein